MRNWTMKMKREKRGNIVIMDCYIKKFKKKTKKITRKIIWLNI